MNIKTTIMNIRKTVLLLAAVIIAAVGASAQTTDEQGRDLDSLYAQSLLKPGDVAPDFSLRTPDGKMVHLSNFKGKYVLLDFWASWCPDCRKDIPTVKVLHEKYGSKVTFLGVSFDNDATRWTDCLKKNEMKWTQVSELKKMRESATAELFGVKWIPSMTLIGPDGKVVLSTVVVERMETALKNIH